MKKKNKQLIVVGVILIAILAIAYFGVPSLQLSVAEKAKQIVVSVGIEKTGSRTTMEETDELIKAEYYELIYDVSWMERGYHDETVYPELEDLRVAEIRSQLQQVQDDLWDDFFEDETLMDYLYPQFAESKIVDCSEFVLDDTVTGAGHWDIQAKTRIQALCIKNPIPIAIIIPIVKLIIIAICLAIIGWILVNVTFYICVLIHGWPPTPPVPPPDWADAELWAKYYEAFKMYSATHMFEQLIWYVVLGILCVAAIFAIIYYISSKASREKIIERVTGRRKKR